MAKHCGNCGAALADGSRFCENCGAKVPEEKPAEQIGRFCSSCGKELPPEAAFCPSCGAKRRVRTGRPGPSIPVTPPSVTNRTPPAVQGRTSPATPPAYMQPGYTRQVREQRQAESGPEPSAPAAKSGRRGLCVFLALVMAAELCVAGFKYPGFLRKKNGVGIVSEPEKPLNAEAGSEIARSPDEYNALLLDYLGMTKEDLADYLENPVEVTEENSPGNPAFIEVGFTKEEYDGAKTLTAPVSRENPEADFPEFGIHVDMKWWNLDNEEDTLIVKRLPDKTDPATGAQLYSYDYSLASGQSKFYTDVEITVPIPEGTHPGNILYLNEETGKWEEIWYEIAGDGKSYTARMSHFSTEAMLNEGLDAVSRNVYEDGKSIFYYLSRENVQKYDSTSHWLYNVGIVDVPNFKRFIDYTSAEDLTKLFEILKKHGGAPLDSGFTQFCDTLGVVGDSAATAVTILDCTGKTLKNVPDPVMKGIGYGLQLLGAGITYLKVSDRMKRNVDADKNALAAMKDSVPLMIGATGILCGAAAAAATGALAVGLEAVAVGLAVVGAGLFIYTTVTETIPGWEAKLTKWYRPLGNPTTLEEGAYYYFLLHSAKSEEGFAKNGNDSMNKTKVYENRPWELCDVLGNGWAEAFDTLFKEYEKEPDKLYNAITKMYDRFVDRFWEMDDSARVRWWSRYGSAYFGDDGEGDLHVIGRYPASLGEKEVERRNKLYKTPRASRNDKALIDFSWNWDDAWKKTVEDLGDEVIRFSDLTPEQIGTFKKNVRTILYENTNPILEEAYRKHYEDAALKARTKIYKEVLPWFNTRLTFYWHDDQVKQGSMVKNSKYYKFLTNREAMRYDFDFDLYHEALFLPGNRTSVDFPLFLEPNKDNPVLLETTVYNYIMWGCPEFVNVIGSNSKGEVKEVLRAKTDWTDVDLRADPKSLTNGNAYFNIPIHLRNIKDVKVPVVFDKATDNASDFWDIYYLYPGTFGAVSVRIDTQIGEKGANFDLNVLMTDYEGDWEVGDSYDLTVRYNSYFYDPEGGTLTYFDPDKDTYEPNPQRGRDAYPLPDKVIFRFKKEDVFRGEGTGDLHIREPEVEIMGIGTFQCFKDDPASSDADDSDIYEDDQFYLP